MAAESEQADWKLPEPVWQADELGTAIPDSPHACSVAMPLWAHNIGYEEGDQSVISKFNAGYPRFFVNPLVTKLKEKLASELGIDPDLTLLAPTANSAHRAVEYVVHRTGSTAKPHQTSAGVWLVQTDEAGKSALGEFWQHAGEVVSSRTADRCLSGESQRITDTQSKRLIRERVAELQHVNPDDVYLFPSGMAAIYAAWRITHESGTCLQHGFPYVDTYKILERFGAKKPILHTDSDVTNPTFETLITEDHVRAVFCEVPGNPLLSVPDVPAIRELANTHGFAVVVDDTLGAMVNTDVTPYADLIATSLTKFFSGGGDLLAGSLIVVPGQPRYEEFKAKLAADFDDMLADGDADVLAANSNDVARRVQTINKSALALARALREHRLVDRVFYPDESSEFFEAVRDQKFPAGFGGLMSVLLKDPENTTTRVYDALQVSKGPNLGTNFTLCCPYTILAHYDELDFAEACGVSRFLLRISVGLEGNDWITRRVLAALDGIK